jgi:hypothetical protein
MDHALAERQFIKGAPSARTKQHHTSPNQNIPHVSSREDLKQRTNGILNIQLAASTSSEQTSRGPVQTTKQQTPHVVTGEGETNSSCRSINQLSKRGKPLTATTLLFVSVSNPTRG